MNKRRSPPETERSAQAASEFAGKLIRWQKRHGRHRLPWQGTRDPYRIWLSEIMLQQTQVATVIPYYERFLARFPDFAALAAADEDEVMRLWSGLGYYSRGRNLHKAARQVLQLGSFPATREGMEQLPGIGRSTAAAIAAFAFGAREAILDGNVKRVLARHFAVAGYPGDKKVENKLWRVAGSLLPRRGIEAYTQALMDLGAAICSVRDPQCAKCPVRSSCAALARGKVDAYPAPRPAKSRPVRRTAMLVLEKSGEVLLEKRPSPGIWGGLWSFPEIEPDGDTAARIIAYGRERFGCEIAATERLATLAHGFTHFRLAIEPWRCPVRRAAPRAHQPGLIWLDVEEAMQAAIPVPVRKILGRF